LKAEKEAAEAELAEFEAEINPHDDGMMNPQDQLPIAPAQYYQPQPAAPLAQPLNEEPPWYTDCEVCGRQGWNIVSFSTPHHLLRQVEKLNEIGRHRMMELKRFAANNAKNGNIYLVTFNETL